MPYKNIPPGHWCFTAPKVQDETERQAKEYYLATVAASIGYLESNQPDQVNFELEPAFTRHRFNPADLLAAVQQR